MNVFLAGIIQGSLVEARIHDQDWRSPIQAALERHLPGADVYCHYSLHPNSITYRLPQIRKTIDEGNHRAAACDLLVAWIPSASMGTAIEMYEAARHGALVLAITPLKANWVVRAYSDRVLPDLEAFEVLLASGEVPEVVRAKRTAARRGPFSREPQASASRRAGRRHGEGGGSP